MQENKIFEALLDVLPFAAYAVDINTYEVIYANRLMQENMYAPREEFCWKRLFGQENVCDWCTVPELRQRETKYQSDKLISSYFNEVTDCWFQSYDELMKWTDGRTVKYSIAVDITEQKEIQAKMIKNNTKLAIQSKKIKEANKKLEFMATKDFLTGINNRGHFFKLAKKMLERKLQTGEQVYFAMLDLDKFKNINDTYGHNVGDLVLKAFTESVEKHLNEDDIFGRLGGEEFVIAMVCSTHRKVLERMKNVKNAIEDLSVASGKQEIKFTVSIGVSARENNETIDVILDKADKKLYEAKSSGRNIIKFRQ